MGLSIKKLLSEYFSKEQVQDALRDIGESTSGTKDELVNRLATNWQTYNRDIYDLLDFTDGDHLQMICYHYNLDSTPAGNSTLIRRIKKADILENSRRNLIKNDSEKHQKFSNDKPTKEIKESPIEKPYSITDHKISKKMLTWTVIGVIATVIGVVASIIFGLK